MTDSPEKRIAINNPDETKKIFQELDTYLDFHKNNHLRIGIRGTKAYLDSILKYFKDKDFEIRMAGKSTEYGNTFPIPEGVSTKDVAGYVVVVDSTGDWDNHTPNKWIKQADLKISDQQNAVFISWSHNKNDTSGAGSEFTTSFIEE